MKWTTLVDVDALAAALGNAEVRLIDARFSLMDPLAGRAGYDASHLPGATYADLNVDLSQLGLAGEGRHPLPDEKTFAGKVGEWGIAPGDQVVVYDAGDGSMAAARLWWMLRLLGHERVAVLDGGLAAWRAKGLPETSQLHPPVAVAPYPAGFDRSRIATSSEVQSRLQDAPGWLLDARAGERFRGEVEPIDPVAGHVPGAVNRPIADNLLAGHFRSAEELQAAIEPLLGGRDPQDVVVMCGSGVTACHLLLAMEHAGLHGARVYAGSWSAWISDPARPIAR
ncbi:sulfurtransferase [Pseudoxanthomonas gei]|uniref:Sulfurtransferase n=1 Tax=Pseudoxanthomonas gei TaxID=1383030 RepID=A0ABX0AEB3_9GAMM|nr:sulfurtransferase [Pseudoxanthomonas gei]NDK38830.1 sulfurtransferase [Pseudoxanthomonas gei]